MPQADPPFDDIADMVTRIKICRESLVEAAARQVELDARMIELVAKAGEALTRSRQLLEETRRMVEGRPSSTF